MRGEFPHSESRWIVRDAQGLTEKVFDQFWDAQSHMLWMHRTAATQFKPYTCTEQVRQVTAWVELPRDPKEKHPYCDAQVGGMECGQPVEKWGQQCERHDPEGVTR